MKQNLPRCTYCDAPSTLLCDFTLGMPDPVYDHVSNLRAPHTCDLPICREHAEHRGNMHIRFSETIKGRRGYFDTIDYCMEHAGAADMHTGSVTDDEAERLRRAVHALAQRRAMRERGVIHGPELGPAQGSLF